METLREVLEQAERNGVAVGPFNVADLVTLKAAFDAARDLKVPVIVGVSEGNGNSWAFGKSPPWSRVYAKNVNFPFS